jgi:hypothetical protein
VAVADLIDMIQVDGQHKVHALTMVASRLEEETYTLQS